MNGIGVKICGINTPQAMQAALEAGADWVGLVFFARSPRFITTETARALTALVPQGGPRRVGLFVKATDDEIAQRLDQVPLDILQIYDTAERAATIRQRFGLPVWHACGIAHRSDLPERTAVDGFVIESKAPPEASLPGGNGLTFDWSLPREWDAPAPWLLAGGLTPDNVQDAIRASGTRAVDVSSGVESAPGKKDAEKIRIFIQSAKTPCLPARTC